MSCASINIKCLKGNYIETDSGEQLFTGMEINIGGNSKVLIRAPYQATYKNGSVKLTGADGVEYNFRINKTKYSVNGLKELIAECNCCAGDAEAWSSNRLIQTESQLPLNPNEGDIAVIEGDGDLRMKMFDGVDWSQDFFFDRESLIEVTYDEIIDIINNEALVIGQFYLITDFATSHYLLNSEDSNLSDVALTPSSGYHTGGQEPLIVMATGVDTLHSRVVSTAYETDIIYYEIGGSFFNTSDIAFTHPDTGMRVPNFKGLIYRRIDPTRNIDCSFDFRRCKFLRYDIATDAYDIDTNYTLNQLLIDSNGGLNINHSKDVTGADPVNGFPWVPIEFGTPFITREGGTSLLGYNYNAGRLTETTAIIGNIYNVKITYSQKSKSILCNIVVASSNVDIVGCNSTVCRARDGYIKADSSFGDVFLTAEYTNIKYSYGGMYLCESCDIDHNVASCIMNSSDTKFNRINGSYFSGGHSFFSNFENSSFVEAYYTQSYSSIVDSFSVNMDHCSFYGNQRNVNYGFDFWQNQVYAVLDSIDFTNGGGYIYNTFTKLIVLADDGVTPRIISFKPIDGTDIML